MVADIAVATCVEKWESAVPVRSRVMQSAMLIRRSYFWTQYWTEPADVWWIASRLMSDIHDRRLIHAKQAFFYHRVQTRGHH